MGKLDDLFIKSYALDENSDREYFNCIRDYCLTDEFISLQNNVQHGRVNVYQHSFSVSYISYIVAREHGLNYYDTARGALLHDLYYYDWHNNDRSHRLHGYRHPGFALKNAEKLCQKTDTVLSEIEKNIIYRHMFPLTVVFPKYKESLLVSAVDKYVSAKEFFVEHFPLFKNSFNRKILFFGKNRKSNVPR